MATVSRGILLAILLAACSNEKPAPITAQAQETDDLSHRIDIFSPSTQLTSQPPSITNQTAASFAFSGKDDVALARFECRLDTAPWRTCESPKLFANLAAGTHLFEVKAIDAAENEDPLPPSYFWRIDLAAPDTSITGGPAAPTSATSATFTFGGSDDFEIGEFECNRDGQGWGACDSPFTYSNLATGTHTFHVRAIDTVGNTDATAAEATWSVYLPYPANPAACFRGGETPQLDLFTGPATYWTWNDPHVLKVEEEYWMYASATSFFTFPVRLYRLQATDGTQWTFDATEPVLADAADGAWDAGGLETPAVVFFQGQYHLFYTGYPYMVGATQHSALDYRVGHAVSNDGITFTRASTAPVVAPSATTDAFGPDAWYTWIAAEPAPVVFNGELFLYFTTVGVDLGLGTNLQVIGVVRSSDGINWSAPELALRPDQTLYPRDEDWIGYSTPNAVVLEGRMHLFFDVAHQPDGGDWKQLRLHHASSPDGLTQWEHDATPIRSAGDFDWAVDEIRSPDAFLDDATLQLYFAGHELDNSNPEYFGVGMMRCDLAGE